MQRSNYFFPRKITVADWLFSTFTFSAETKQIVGLTGSDGRVFPSIMQTIVEMHELAQKDKTGELQKINDIRFKELFGDADLFTNSFKVEYATLIHYIETYLSLASPIELVRTVNLESFCSLYKVLRTELLLGEDELFEVNRSESVHLKHDFLSAHDFLLKRYECYKMLLLRIEAYNRAVSFTRLKRKLDNSHTFESEMIVHCLKEVQTALSFFNENCREFTIPDFIHDLDIQCPHNFHLNVVWDTGIKLEAKLKSNSFFYVMGKSLYTTIVEYQD